MLSKNPNDRPKIDDIVNIRAQFIQDKKLSTKAKEEEEKKMEVPSAIPPSKIKISVTPDDQVFQHTPAKILKNN